MLYEEHEEGHREDDNEQELDYDEFTQVPRHARGHGAAWLAMAPVRWALSALATPQGRVHQLASRSEASACRSQQVLARVVDVKVPPGERDGASYELTLHRWLENSFILPFKKLMNEKRRGVVADKL